MRHAVFYILLSAFALCVFAQPLWAAESRNPRTELVAEMNRLKPLQNPRYDVSKTILERRMLDRKNKVIGTVKDVVLNENGNISYLDVDFDRIQLSRPVFLNYSTLDIKPVSDGYGMTYDAKEIEDLYPSLLANIETASGEEDSYSLSKLPGLEVWTVGGRNIGRVDDVLFTSNGERAEALYVGLTLGTLRGKGVAMPFGEADFSKAASTHRVTIGDEMADAMIKFAQEK